MKTLLAMLVTMLVCSPVLAGDGKIQKSRRPIANHYLVQFEDFVESPGEEAKAIALQYSVKLDHIYKHGVTGFAMEASPEQAVAISEDSRVEHVEEEGRVKMQQAEPGWWGLDRINQSALPLDYSTNAGCNGGLGVVVYVLDTGINPSTTEFGNRLTNGYTVDEVNGIKDFSDEHGTHGHGTAVASIIGGATFGVARSVKLVNVKVLRPSSPDALGDKIAGIDWVVQQHDNDVNSPKLPKVMNLSWQSQRSTMLENKVLDAIRKGIVVVVSAGNYFGDICESAAPSNLGRPNHPPYNYDPSLSTITVGATQLLNPYSANAFDELWRTSTQGSSYGPCVDIFAPGDRVNALSRNGLKRPETDLFGGSSAAAAFVSGAVARHLSNYIGTYLMLPEWAAVRAETIENRLKSYATRDLIANYPPSGKYLEYSDLDLLLFTFYAKCRAVG